MIENTSNGNFTEPPLTHEAKYSLNAKALQKWSAERLQLKEMPDGSVEARFRYEGTTCFNLGQPLEYEFRVRLSPTGEGHRILEESCVPAPGDTGYTAQCEYQSNVKSFMREVAEEKPLLGQPLNDVLTWKRSYDPSGCFCDPHRRAHKWGLVLEVIHYALVRRQAQMANGQPPSFSEISEKTL